MYSLSFHFFPGNQGTTEKNSNARKHCMRKGKHEKCTDLVHKVEQRILAVIKSNSGAVCHHTLCLLYFHLFCSQKEISCIIQRVSLSFMKKQYRNQVISQSNTACTLCHFTFSLAIKVLLRKIQKPENIA